MWTAWYATLSQRLKAKHDIAMRFIAAGNWDGQHYKRFSGNHLKGLGEIRILGEVQWRLIGHRDTAKDTYTIVMICNHKDNAYYPRNALETAARRWKEMKDGLLGVNVNEYPA